jgi:hypothetical protein
VAGSDRPLIATTSSGFTDLLGSFPKNLVTSSIIFGILVIPPTKITSSIFEASVFASFKACFTGPNDFSMRGATSVSNFDLVILTVKWSGPDGPCVMNG